MLEQIHEKIPQIYHELVERKSFNLKLSFKVLLIQNTASTQSLGHECKSYLDKGVVTTNCTPIHLHCCKLQINIPWSSLVDCPHVDLLHLIWNTQLLYVRFIFIQFNIPSLSSSISNLLLLLLTQKWQSINLKKKY